MSDQHDDKCAAPPARVQLRRTKGWRKPEGAIVVARPSKWGNWWRVRRDAYGWMAEFDPNGSLPYGVAPTGPGEAGRLLAARVAVEKFKRDINDARRGLFPVPFPLDLAELRGHDLACWCPLDQPCHADVLLELANGSAS